MKDSRISSVWVALMGVLLGMLIMLLIVRLSPKQNTSIGRREWTKLNLILNKIEDCYVDTIDFSAVTEAAASAALGALDPHSIYLPPVELGESEEDLSGNFEGIGIQFNVPNDTAVVMEVIPGGPSEKIGLQKGDRLIKVNGTDIAGVKFPQDSMVRRMKGPAGTKVTVTVKRGKEVIPFEITRDKIRTHSVSACFMVNDTTGYIRLDKFSRTSANEFYTHGAILEAGGMRHLIFDLRDNTGGYLDQALTLSNLLLAKGDTIVYTQGRKSRKEVFCADGKGPFQDVRLSILIDDVTASSSEIVAGAIQDNGRGKIVGRRSFGKGLVQEPFYFNDGSGIRLTVARYYTPSGRCIQKPYSKDYNYDIYRRYESGEMVNADSMKIENGGIIPDIFVPVDTTRATPFYINCNKKATAMRFAAEFFDSHKDELSAIEDYPALVKYLDAAGLEQKFLSFAAKKDALVPKPGEWAEDKSYMMTQVRALVGRYSAMGDNAFYHVYLDIDDTFKAALTAQ